MQVSPLCFPEHFGFPYGLGSISWHIGQIISDKLSDSYKYLISIFILYRGHLNLLIFSVHTITILFYCHFDDTTFCTSRIWEIRKEVKKNRKKNRFKEVIKCW